MNVEKWINNNSFNLKGKVVAITGATGGLGSTLCKHLAKLNADILMLNRDLEKSQKLKDELLIEFPNANIEIIKLDLSNMQNVKEVCLELKDRKLDFFVFNAGVYKVPLVKTDLGYNNVFQVNFISPYHLVKTLLPSFRKAKTKIIAVGSIAHKIAKLNENDIDYSNKKSAIKIYGNSKRFLMFSLYELLKNENDIEFAVTHPGITLTSMTSHYHKSINWLIKIGVKTLFPNPQKAVLNIMLALFKDCSYFEWIGPKYFDVWGTPNV